MPIVQHYVMESYRHVPLNLTPVFRFGWSVVIGRQIEHGFLKAHVYIYIIYICIFSIVFLKCACLYMYCNLCTVYSFCSCVCQYISLYMLIESLYYKCRLQILVSRNNLGIPLSTNTNRTEIEYKRYTNTLRICTTYEVKTMRHSGNCQL